LPLLLHDLANYARAAHREKIEFEMDNLKRSVSDIEGTFAGTALRISDLHKDMLGFQARMEQRFDRVLGKPGQVGGRFDRIDGKFDRIERELRALRVDIPKIIRRAVRDARRQSAEAVVRTE
jgi:hypothetical protein